MNKFARDRERRDHDNPIQSTIPYPQIPRGQQQYHGPGLRKSSSHEALSSESFCNERLVDNAFHPLNLRDRRFSSMAAARKPVSDIAAAIVTAAHMSRI